jgi:Holliday junction resolvase RusA-like endonuclease
MKLVVEGRFPGLNKYTRANRGSTGWGSSVKKKWTNIVAWACKEQELEEAEEPIDIKFVWYEKNRRRDPDNFAFAKKFVLDGLEKAGVIKNDGWKNIKSFSDQWKVDKNEPKVEVFINE